MSIAANLTFLITKFLTTMKKIFLLFLFVGIAGLTAQAQSCHSSKKAAEKAQATAVSQDQSAEVLAAAEKAAAADENIEKRVCEKSGKVSFVRKSVCEKSGTVSYKPVIYNAEKGAFVDAPQKSCSAKEKAACAKKGKSCSKGAKDASNAKACTDKAKGEKKACCAKGEKAGKGCCSKKKASRE